MRSVDACRGDAQSGHDFKQATPQQRVDERKSDAPVNPEESVSMSPKSATQPVSIDAPAEDAFYIAATQSASRPRRSLKSNDTFIVLDTHGDMGAAAGGTDGLFSHDTRFLSRLQLLINGEQPLLLGSNLRDDNAALVVDLTNPDVFADQRIMLGKGHAAYLAHGLPLARHGLSAVRLAQLW